MNPSRRSVLAGSAVAPGALALPGKAHAADWVHS
jgi:hypothetical protein